MPTLPEKGLKVQAPLGPSQELPARPCPDANLTLWGGSLGPSAWSVLGSVKTAILVRWQGQLGGASHPTPPTPSSSRGRGKAPFLADPRVVSGRSHQPQHRLALRNLGTSGA